MDARTLVEKFRFGDGVLESISGMAIVNDELYVGDFKRRSLHVFSMAGERLRELRGDWREPRALAFWRGRLYLSEYHGEVEEEPEDGPEEEEDWSEDKKAAGKRIFVLTPEGATLQVFDRFANPIERIFSLVATRNKLLVHGACATVPEPEETVEMLGA